MELGGEKISASSFEEYDIVISNGLSKSISGGKKLSIDIPTNYLYDFAFSVSKDGSVLLYNIQDNKVLVGNDVKELYFFSSKMLGTPDIIVDTALYAGIYVLSDRLLPEMAEKIFIPLGDNHYYKMLANAFGKQKLNAFKTAIKECVADVSKRFPDGKATIQKVPDNAYCLMNLIEDLGNIDGCLFYPNHPDFTYNRIGRKRVVKGNNLSETEKKRLSEAKNLEEATTILKELEEKSVEVKFVNTDSDRGYPLTDLVYNESRANLSLRIYINGEAILPKNKFGIEKVASFKYNTFTLIKDGIVNVEKLPVSYSAELHQLLNEKKVKWELYTVAGAFTNTIVIDLNSIPVINRGMVKTISANELAKEEWNLLRLQGDNKVYSFYKNLLFPKTSKSFVEILGQEAADWLKEVGITDYNGFAPKTVEEESTDFYMSVNLETKVKGASSLPKVEDVLAKIKAGKELKLSEWLLSDAIKLYMRETESELYKSLSEEQQKGVLKTYLETKTNILNKQKRKVMQKIAEIKFSLILSKKYFIEFKSMDENKLNLKFDGQDLEFTFSLCEKEQKI